MGQKTKFLATFLAVTSVACAAQSATWADGKTNHTGNGLVSSNNYTNSFIFTVNDLGANGAAVPSGITINLTNGFIPFASAPSIELDSVSIVNGLPVVNQNIASTTGVTLTAANLSAGQYLTNGQTYELIVKSASTALYSFTSNITALSAVPIPGAVVLFGSGLLGLAALGRRRVAKGSALES